MDVLKWPTILKIENEPNILTFAITTYARRSPMEKLFWIRFNQQTNWLIVLLSHYQHLLLKHGFIN